ncbi:hypothetical protein [Paenibacillus polymyxa]|uniref:hypothetical protein n=1 Tax=Paenibacillus polymyxa TaxID=1406 RepID=UPI00287FD459|nr:hypothetical protein [Paenibacillus polymyxa]
MEIAAKARLRPKKDDDLIKVWNSLPLHKDKSDIVREALRLFFFGECSTYNHQTQIPLTRLHSESEEVVMDKVEEIVDVQDYEDKFDVLLNSFG